MARKKESWKPPLVVLALLGVALFSFFSCPFFFPQAKCAFPECNDQYATAPVFNDPDAKLAELSNGKFTMTLFGEAAAFEPLINRSGTQVHIGFWSGKGNHGSLVRLLDDINNYASVVNGTAQRAIWDEGTQSSLQYPSYAALNAREHWYERSSQSNGTVAIYGVNYADPYNVTFQEADAIWGEYSKRYAEMAEAVGLPLSDERKSFLDANGNNMESIGGKLALRYAGRTYAIYGFISKTLSNNCLLGMDFLTRYDVKIDARSGRLHFK